nr:exopolygalacturonase X [Colletotrichum truncatum]KAF6790428.1 exopolygalacturonase X [Colletotrichum truncatum]
MQLPVTLAVAALASTVVQARDFIPRPDIQPGPIKPYKAIPKSTPRTKTCFVKPSCTKGRDDTPKIMAAMHECNNGGTIVLDSEYNVCSPMDLRFLKHVDIAITGTINFCDDVDHWLPLLFMYDYQFAASQWVIGGEDVNIYGAGVGTLNGNGQNWYDRFDTNRTLIRPILLLTDGLRGGSITGLKMRNSAKWHNLIMNSSDVLISDFDIYSRSTSSYEAKNLDGWDTYISDNIIIQNSWVEHDDDCVSFKPNSTNIIIQGLTCFGSHGISVGSLGQYPKSFDIVENVYIYNNTLNGAADSARIKVWPGAETDFQPDLAGGGGAGYVRNITYDGFYGTNNDNAIKIDQCYGEKNATRCAEFPSKMNISDIVFKNFAITTNSKNAPRAGDLICSGPGTCKNIRADNITITVPGTQEQYWACRYVDESLLNLGGRGCVPA